MSSLYDLYQPGHSWLYRLDPRAKLLFVCCGFAVLLLMRNLWVMLAALLLTLAMLRSAGIARNRIAWVWRMTLPTMTMIALLWVVFYPGKGPAILEVWFLRITWQNLAEGLAIALRIGTLSFVAFVWLFTTDQATLVRGLVALGLPFEWGLTVAMGLRYIPTMASAFGMISEAQQARGLDLRKGGPLRRARAYVPIIVAMLITALRTAQQLSHALESRALGAVRQRTYLRQLAFGVIDWAWTLSVLLGTIALVWARFVYGLGVEPLRLLCF